MCLYSGEGLDLRAMLRGGCSDEEIAEAVTNVIERKPKEHHFTEDGLHLPGIGPEDADTMTALVHSCTVNCWSLC